MLGFGGDERRSAARAREEFAEASAECLGNSCRRPSPRTRAWLLVGLGLAFGAASCAGTRDPDEPYWAQRDRPGEPPVVQPGRPAKPEPFPPHPEVAESNGPPEDMPPPYLLHSDLAALGSQAGESLAAATTALSALGPGRTIALGEIVLDLPWLELARAVEPRVVTDSLGDVVAARTSLRFVPASPAFPSSAALVGRLTACVRRSGGGHVAADYALALAVVESGSTRIPWAAVFERTRVGSKGPLKAHSLLGADLEALALEATAFVSSELRARGVGHLHVAPDSGPDPLGLASDQLALKAAFADRVLVQLVARGFSVHASEAEAGAGAARVAVSAGGVHDDPVIDAETYRFGVEVSGAGGREVWRRWERILARSGGRVASSGEAPR